MVLNTGIIVQLCNRETKLIAETWRLETAEAIVVDEIERIAGPQ
jgi:hypothetical protein